ncbi:RagB/SusD family nutrient uptake outer membrane protein [Labilibacter marinus]|uniref:RagB/SusD family nutrient uptake outer membrane protein n=1 Tax=Labilibacter marinus TaxID=1477105 RepID=UPI00094FBAD9|nr:RagB/SusD family nutrient uptake outer membrane protein [Labilibacter marinus]
MKNIHIIYLFISVMCLSLVGCSDILETEDKSAFAEDLIYSDPDQVERLLFTVYNSTESWGMNRFQWWSRRFNIEGASFEAKFNFKDLDLFRVRAGWTPSNVGVFAQKWNNYWDYIRLCNEFLDKIDESPAMVSNPEKVAVYKAEMKFLRANLYAKLIKYYGGVPILERALGLDDDFNLTRNSYEECVNFIVKELDEVIAVLPATRPDAEFGRATSLAAMAVKSRTLLYAASKLHDPANVPSENSELYAYSKATKWQDASDAAKEVITVVSERDLIAVADAEAYQNMFLSPNEDILFARPFSSEYYDYGTDVNSLWDMTMSPNGYGGWALSSPTHNFALQYNMADGTSTSEASFDPSNPNDGREMRYYATLNYNGSQFRGRDVQYYLSENPAANPHGLDSPQGQGNPLHSSKTGYNIRKFQDESLGDLTEISSERPYILYRLAEIYLNYAEAQYQLDNEDEARKFLNKVSMRALQPEITASGDALLEAIKRERRVELCFEGHNFFDERRWMETDHLGFDVQGLKWTKAVNGDVSFEEYTVVTRPWWDKHYYLPIPQTEVEKAPNMLQNFGY